jgi:hypothetical protein
MSARHGAWVGVAALLALAATAADLPAVGRQAVFAEVEKVSELLSDGAAETDEKSLIVSEAQPPYVMALFFEEGYDGGNGGIQYLAIFRRNAQPEDEVAYRVRPLQLMSVTKVGEDFVRVFDAISIDGDRITLTGKRWHDDAHCCPSHSVTASFRFDEHAITELGAGKK